MITTLYKPLALILGVISGMLAGKIVDVAWQRIGDDAAPPDPEQRDTTWKMVLLGAALQGAVYASVKAAVKRGGATGVQKATGTWPGQTAKAA
ncbi:MAG: DUF4235 domain-containing protein [Sporichthyaceae bacterium]